MASNDKPQLGSESLQRPDFDALAEKTGGFTSTPDDLGISEKAAYKASDSDSIASDKRSIADDESDVQLVNGEPVITTGRDVSRFLVDTRDDGDPALTFRSMFLGTVFAGLGAALYQVRNVFSPYGVISLTLCISP